MFRIAQDYGPVIIFIDEADSVGSHRSDDNRGGGKNACDQIIMEMNKRDTYDKVYVIAATNRPGKNFSLKPYQSHIV